MIDLIGSSSGRLNVLCVGAHADDIEIGAGGTILRLVSEGRIESVRWAVLSGDATRASEARAAAERFLDGVADPSITIDGFPDGHLPAHWDEVKEAIETLAREGRPDLILAPRLDDRHQDHRLVGELVWTAFRDATILEYEIPKWEGDLVTPNVYVHLPLALAERKTQILMDVFPSQVQRPWFTPDAFLALARLRGIESRAPEHHAEGFHARKLTF